MKASGSILFIKARKLAVNGGGDGKQIEKKTTLAFAHRIEAVKKGIPVVEALAIVDLKRVGDAHRQHQHFRMIVIREHDGVPDGAKTSDTGSG